MKQLNISILIFLFFILVPMNINAQIWPFRSMIRFGNTVYYETDSLSNKGLRGTSILWHDTIVSNRYFDILSKLDSIKIMFKDSAVYFHQKNRNEPKNYKEILFYGRRKLRSENIKIKYLKLIELNQSSITAEAKMRIKANHRSHIMKENVVIPKSEIDGVFLGTGKTNRNIMTFVEIGATIAAIVIVIY